MRSHCYSIIRTFSARTMDTSTLTTMAERLKGVNERMKSAVAKRPQKYQYAEPRLLAVSKTKGLDLIFEAYDAGQRHFGENYVMEIHEKANDIELQDRCEDIKWHFIGHLQRNKVNKVLGVPNLYLIESVDSKKLAKAINDSWDRMKKNECLRVLAQCNTSGEESKSGCTPEELVDLAKYIVEECPRLRLVGLMTIGVYEYDYSKGPNPDFLCLKSLREEVCKALNIPEGDLDLSMGMSSDFEQAIEAGSTHVRVGTTIFGARKKKMESTTASKDDSSVNDTAQGVKDISIS